MGLSKNELKHIIKLSMLEIDESKLEKLSKDMDEIVKMVDKLGELNCDESLSKFSVQGNTNVFRVDEIKSSLSREEALKNAPDKKAGCFFVPKIVE